jgi:uncharacterized protein (DUF1330 family)
MSAYVILDIEVIDPVQYDAYRKLAPATVTMYGGKYLARGGKTEAVEGDWKPSRLVILEFASFEQAKTWLNSPEYCAIKPIRLQSTHSKTVILEGVDPL